MGVVTTSGNHVVYDLRTNEAHFGAARAEGPALVWKLVGDPGPGAWLLRCDRVDFPPGGIAYRHVHPGVGIRRLLHGELTIARDDGTHTYRAGESWLEEADDPVTATASATDETAFVRVLLLPEEWRGKRTIRYLDPADEEKPKRQRATVLLEEPLAQ
ncbi:MAG: cupin domain-containing protein [Actinomycetota bacterium]|nr:cupin domain-containing protein [Actinomycetota bacterium]